MKKTAYILSLSLLILAIFQFSSPKKTLLINLTWHKAYAAQSWKQAKTGFLWSFSYLGAELPKQCFDKSLSFIDSSAFTIDLVKLGFNQKALAALRVVCDSIKSSTDYKYNNAIDASRFLMLTLYSPYHYYKITGVEKTLNDFMTKYQLGNPVLFGVTKSSVSKSHRCIKFNYKSSPLKTGFLAEEGSGSLHEKTFEPEFYEAFDVMPNGQFRYAIYDKAGQLTDASAEGLSAAGKPGKCMWCHETYFQPLFLKNTQVEKMLSNEEFDAQIKYFQKALDAYRKTLTTEIDFSNKQDHTASELLYISFMEPSIYRLSQELKKDSTELKSLIKEEAHVYDEFLFLGKLYNRKHIDSYFPYDKIRVPDFAREKSLYEPNYFK